MSQIQVPMSDWKTKRVRKAMKAYLDYWVPVLRLEQWNFTLRIVNELSGFASVNGNVNHLTAEIKIRHPKYTDLDTVACVDPEVTLVHELVHLHFPENKEIPEVTIEMVALALVAAKRGLTSKELQSGGR